MTDTEEFAYGHPSQHTGAMSAQHTVRYLSTGELQLPLFDTANPDETWKTTDDWSDVIKEVDELREFSQALDVATETTDG
jgi:hypothetical protein